MKKSILLAFISMFIFSSFGQTILRVNNTAGLTGTNIYATVQAAHDAAASGDIIYIEPTVNLGLYGALVVTKQINIIGTGYFLDLNSNVTYDKRVPYIDQVTFKKGSANSTMMGVYVSSALSINCENITVTRCRLNGVSMGVDNTTVPAFPTYGNNATITKCFITGSQVYSTGGGGVNCYIGNNILGGQYTSVTVGPFTSSTITYNTVAPLNYGQYQGYFANLTSCTVSNNIFDLRNFNNNTSVIQASTGTISNNVCIGINGLPSGNGNVNSASTTNLYTVADPNNFNSTGDAGYQLGVGSAAIGAGAFAGSSPYVLSGLPTIPIITNFVESGVGNSSTPLSVSVTIRGNN